MAKGYKLAPNESILMNSDRISYGGALAAFKDELVLTNQHIILINKGIFGNVKNVQYYNLNQIKVFNNKVQVLVRRKQNGSPILDVYFINGQESFGFESKRKALQWAEHIALLVGGQDVEIGNLGKQIGGEFDSFAEQLTDVADQLREQVGLAGESFKLALGIRPHDIKKNKPVNERVATKCYACGAPLSGIKGQIIKCQYCDTDSQL